MNSAALDMLSDRELLVLYGRVLDTLRSRGTTRSVNNPIADYAEGLSETLSNPPTN
jgi:hypothetical protein